MSSQRPKISDQEIADAINEKLFSQLVVWLEGNGDNTDYKDDENKAELKKQINGMLRSCHVLDDGYRLARYMEQDGWDPDAQLVEILDHVQTYARTALRELSTAWWARQNFSRHASGTKVRVLLECRNDAKGHVGTITDFHHDGKYTVNIPEIGHVQPGRSGTTGIILEHELLEVVI